MSRMSSNLKARPQRAKPRSPRSTGCTSTNSGSGAGSKFGGRSWDNCLIRLKWHTCREGGIHSGMERTFAAIPARSKQQALDWSLVLVSQGIESTIERVPEERWQLVVESND